MGWAKSFHLITVDSRWSLLFKKTFSTRGLAIRFLSIFSRSETVTQKVRKIIGTSHVVCIHPYFKNDYQVMFSRSDSVENYEIIETPSLSSRGYLQALTMRNTSMAQPIMIISCVKEVSVGTSWSDDAMATRKKKGLGDKTITLHVHHTFLFISLPFLHD